MSVKEDFAFIIYCTTFACWMGAYAVGWLSDDLPPRGRWLGVLLFGTAVYWLFGILGL